MKKLQKIFIEYLISKKGNTKAYSFWLLMFGLLTTLFGLRLITIINRVNKNFLTSDNEFENTLGV